ncbi:MAG: c-type cytochrome [Candidatus Puniceispirillales bacterium]|jgi:cytochrome c|tara:strand:+ start:72 stop:605 length:534 start_codon:yes stop_codon:yes gene_type:complete
MDALRINKIAAALLSGVLLIMVFGKIGNILVDPKTEISNAYPIEVPEKNQIKSKVVEEVVIEPILALLATANLESGQKISKKCVACHGFDAGGPNKVGPNLYNIVNKDQGKADYAYSKVLASLSGKWSYEELNKFLYKPKLYSKGTKMNYAGLSKTKDRANLIAWLRTKSDSPVSLP